MNGDVAEADGAPKDYLPQHCGHPQLLSMVD
jgi:hypothetical protein